MTDDNAPALDALSPDASLAEARSVEARSLEELGGWAAVYAKLTARTDLSVEEAAAATAEILAGNATNAQIGALVMGLRVKGEAVAEMAGMSAAMLDAAAPLSIPAEAIDIVGTGGSPHRQKHALNVSTMACFVAAGAGAVVCKHGNFRASSTSGSSDFLSTLGLEVMLEAPLLEQCVNEIGLGFAQARLFHPALRHAGPVRAELGVPTVFNLLGPIAHPGRIKRQVVGTATEAIAAQLSEVLATTGSVRSWVVTGAGGLDEISTTGPSVIFDVREGNVERTEVDVAALGITIPASMDELAGGDAQANVEIFYRILSGQESGAKADIVALNAAAGLVVAGLAEDLAEGLEAARESIADGRARAKLDALLELAAPQ